MNEGPATESAAADEFQYFHLDQFTVYRPDQKLHPNELAPLRHLCAKLGK